MEYRTTNPEDDDFESEEDEFEAIKDYVEGLTATGPDDILDSLLIMANICESRALMRCADAHVASWYSLLAANLRTALTNITTHSDYSYPNHKLENPVLYFDKPKIVH